jgi:hypothetical protein
MTPSTSPARNRRDHILPKGYLTGFTDTGREDGRLYAINVDRQSWFTTSPASVASQRGYYDYSENASPDATADQAFEEFESKFPPLRRELVTSGFSDWTKHREFLVSYSQMLRARSELFRQEALEQVNNSTLLTVAEVKPTSLTYTEFDPQDDERLSLFKNLTITKMREEIKRGAGDFAGWHWCLRFTSDIAMPVVTADNAIALIGTGPQSRDDAMRHPDTIFVFPICWQACLIGSTRKFDTETEAIHPSLLAEFHKLYLTQSGCRFAYSPTELN